VSTARPLTPRSSNRPAGLSVLDDHSQGDAEDGPKQRPHDDQKLAEPAKRSIHGALQVRRTAMAFKLIESAQARWRAVNAPHLVALVRAGARFENGQLVERPDESGGDQQAA
jgi:hypothetical protein